MEGPEILARGGVPEACAICGGPAEVLDPDAPPPTLRLSRYLRFRPPGTGGFGADSAEGAGATRRRAGCVKRGVSQDAQCLLVSGQGPASEQVRHSRQYRITPGFPGSLAGSAQAVEVIRAHEPSPGARGKSAGADTYGRPVLIGFWGPSLGVADAPVQFRWEGCHQVPPHEWSAGFRRGSTRTRTPAALRRASVRCQQRRAPCP